MEYAPSFAESVLAKHQLLLLNTRRSLAKPRRSKNPPRVASRGEGGMVEEIVCRSCLQTLQKYTVSRKGQKIGGRQILQDRTVSSVLGCIQPPVVVSRMNTSVSSSRDQHFIHVDSEFVNPSVLWRAITLRAVGGGKWIRTMSNPTSFLASRAGNGYAARKFLGFCFRRNP